MLWPQVPEDITTLSAAEARALSREIKTSLTAALLDPKLSAEDREQVPVFTKHRTDLIEFAKGRDASDKAAKALESDTSDDEPEADPPAPEPDADTEAADGGGDGGSTDEPETDPAASGGGTALATKPKTFGQAAVKTEAKRLTIDNLVASDGVDGMNAGDAFESWTHLAASIERRANSIRTDAESKFQVAAIKANYPKDRILSENPHFNLAKFDQEELTAAFCAPATPYYGISCANTLRRPVQTSLPGFQETRMKVSIMPSPTLSDINAGYGIWLDTYDDDAARGKVCETIDCGSPTEYKMYGVWRCLTVKNLMMMSYPELVEAWLNRLGAAHARLAEQTLLAAMYAGTTELDAPRLGYGATTSILSTMLNYLALYNETQRWENVGNMEAWAPRWVLWGIKMDLFRRRQTGSGVPMVASDDDINRMFANAGFNMHWFLDTPSYAVSIPGVGSSTLNLIPQSVQIIVAQPGKFALMDRGELSIGVTGNGMYRDNSSNTHNQFTFFFENFEGIVNTNTCPAHTLDIPVCWNGVQIDDIVINCQGGDEAGYQS